MSLTPLLQGWSSADAPCIAQLKTWREELVHPGVFPLLADVCCVVEAQGDCPGDWRVAFSGREMASSSSSTSSFEGSTWLRIVFSPDLKEVPRFWFEGHVRHLCVSLAGVPFVPLRSDVARALDGFNANDAKYVVGLGVRWW